MLAGTEKKKVLIRPFFVYALLVAVVFLIALMLLKAD